MKLIATLAPRFGVLFILFLLWGVFDEARAESASPVSIPVLTLADSINPGSADFILSGISRAEKDKAPFLVLQLDTPGGLLSSTRQIVQKMLNSSIPIVVFVAPRGAHAGSAGALITFAADVAAMAPGTNIGAAHPVAGAGEKVDKVMQDKMTNDTVAFAESLAKSRGRNIDWAAKSVRDSASLIAEEALKANVIDLVADDLPALLGKLPGFSLRVTKGQFSSIPAGPFVAQPVPMALKHRTVSFFADPNLAYLIMSLGGLCLWVELTHPGLIFPGVLGVVCMLISLVSFQMLPISYGALGLVLAGMAMMVAELFLPTFGLLGLGGVVAFIFGSLFLMDTTVPEFQISLGLILPTATVLASAMVALGILIMKSQKQRLMSGVQTFIGQFGELREAASEKPGKIFIQGELWNAVSQDGEEIPKGSVVVVKDVRDLLLVVAAKAAKTV